MKYFIKFLFVFFLIQGPSVTWASFLETSIEFSSPQKFENHPLVLTLRTENVSLTHHMLSAKDLALPDLSNLRVIDENDALVNATGDQPLGTIGLYYCIALLLPERNSLCHLNEYCHKDPGAPIEVKLDEFFGKINDFSLDSPVHLVSRHISERLLNILSYLRHKGHQNIHLHSYSGVVEEAEKTRKMIAFEETRDLAPLMYSPSRVLAALHPSLNAFFSSDRGVFTIQGELVCAEVDYPTSELSKLRGPYREFSSKDGKLNYLTSEVVSIPNFRMANGKLFMDLGGK